MSWHMKTFVSTILWTVQEQTRYWNNSVPNDEMWASLWTATPCQLYKWHHQRNKNTKFENSHHLRKWPTFLLTASKVLLCVIPHHRVKIRVHTTTSHFRSTVCVIQLVCSVQKLCKIPSAYMVMLETTQQTLSRICSGTEGVNSGKPPSLSYQPQFM